MVFRSGAGGHGADGGDAEGCEPAFEGEGARILQGCQGFGGIFLAKAAGLVIGAEVEGAELLHRKGE